MSPAATTIAFLNAATISQTVAGVTVGVGTVYTLTVDIGHRLDGAQDGILGGTADLLINGNTYAAVGAVPAYGNFGVFTATYVGRAADAGLPITIELHGLGLTTAGQHQGDFDNVQLGAVPEPASFLLFGSALLAVGAIRRRRKA